jgi:hypothetical protein
VAAASNGALTTELIISLLAALWSASSGTGNLMHAVNIAYDEDETAGAGFAGYMTVLFLSIALWWGLANVMDSGWAALIVAVIWGVVAAVLYTTGRAKLRQVHPRPDRTVETLSNVPDALKAGEEVPRDQCERPR